MALLVALLNSMWGAYPEMDAAGSSVAFEVTTDPDRAPDADAVVVHLPTAPPLDELPARRPGQCWVAYSMESEVTVPALADPASMRRFDLEMSYRRRADVWTPYVGRSSLPSLLAAPRPKTAWHSAARFQSDGYDRSGRNALAAALTLRMRVASYGSVAPTVPEAGSVTTREERLAILGRHRFTLAFENSRAEDYVTEKAFDAWRAGSVPVYLGAPNVADFAPAPDSYVDASDFAGPGELAAHLLFLERHPDEYERLLRWKRDGPDARFLALLDEVPRDAFSRLAEIVAGTIAP